MIQSSEGGGFLRPPATEPLGAALPAPKTAVVVVPAATAPPAPKLSPEEEAWRQYMQARLPYMPGPEDYNNPVLQALTADGFTDPNTLPPLRPATSGPVLGPEIPEAFTGTAAEGNPGNIGGRVTRLTPEQYSALDAEQKALVDWNTGLVQAVRRDRKNQDQYLRDGAGPDYDRLMAELFGGNQAANFVAPEVLRYLDRMGYQPSEDRSINDFLGLNAAVTDDEMLKLLDNTPEQYGQLELEKAVRESIGNLGFMDIPEQHKQNPDLNAFFQMAYAAMADPEAWAMGLETIADRLTPLELDLFRNYVVKRMPLESVELQPQALAALGVEPPKKKGK